MKEKKIMIEDMFGMKHVQRECISEKILINDFEFNDDEAISINKELGFHLESKVLNANVPLGFDQELEDFEMYDNKMQTRLGFSPLSIWKPDWFKVVNRFKKLIGDDGSTRELKGSKMKLLGSKYETSIFNPHLAMMILRAYAPPVEFDNNNEITHSPKVYDPFGGGGTRCIIAAAMGYDYHGVELREVEVNRIHKQIERLKLEKCNLVVGDSAQYPFGENEFDFSYTCPPYFDLEVYSDLENDLSNAGTYENFLVMMKDVLAGVYKGLKPDCFSVWVVGNFRVTNKKHYPNHVEGEFIHFSGDLIHIAKEMGFIIHDEIVFHGAAGIANQRAGQFEANKKIVRVHEYVIILKKPKDAIVKPTKSVKEVDNNEDNEEKPKSKFELLMAKKKKKAKVVEDTVIEGQLNLFEKEE
jgi:DNA modification methylase